VLSGESSIMAEYAGKVIKNVNNKKVIVRIITPYEIIQSKFSESGVKKGLKNVFFLIFSVFLGYGVVFK
jgi:hypothetical protein